MALGRGYQVRTSRSAAVGRGLAAEVNAGIGTMIAFATAPNSIAIDGMVGQRNSPYTTALLKHIRTPGADISVVMRLVRFDVLAATTKGKYHGSTIR